VIRVCALLSRQIPTVIVCNSRHAAQVHRALGYAPRFVIVPNGLDVRLFVSRDECRGQARRALGIPDAVRVVGHVGRMDRQKDHPTLMAAFERVAAAEPDTWLVLAGEGLAAGDAYLTRLLRESTCAARVIALGQRDDVQEVMSSMDVFALSSVGEAFPNVLIEAMACGIPCVVTDAGDSADIVADTGWVVPARDPWALSVALRDALNESSHQRANRRQRARCRVEDNYGIDRMVRAYRDIWNAAAAGALKPCAA
jgi:glycosyltransferase involved in cell wall biosynthesis